MAEDMFVVNGCADGKEEEEKLLMDGVAVLDFDMLCSAVAAMQSQGKCKWNELDNPEDHEDSEFGGGGRGGGVLRMWEGDLLNCLDDRSIALESACCPCYRFGKNMRRAGFGFCFIQGIVYMILAVAALVNMTAFIVTRRHCFLYLGVAFTISVGAYLGFYRTQITKKFNIRGNGSLLDDCLYHLVCPCCTLSQESRTLVMNNVQDGTWHGRGDTICVGAYNEGSKGNFELSAPHVISITSPERSLTGLLKLPRLVILHPWLHHSDKTAKISEFCMDYRHFFSLERFLLQDVDKLNNSGFQGQPV